jgi:hypothetical protein
MPAEASATASASGPAKRAVGRPFRPGESGNPGGVPRRAQVLFDALASEFGADTLTAMQREYLKRAADLMRQAERAKGANASVRLSRCADQMVGRVREMRRDRKAAQPAGSALDRYLAGKAEAQP